MHSSCLDASRSRSRRASGAARMRDTRVATITFPRRNCSMKNAFTPRVAVIGCGQPKPEREDYLDEALVDTCGGPVGGRRSLSICKHGFRPERWLDHAA